MGGTLNIFTAVITLFVKELQLQTSDMLGIVAMS